MKLTVQRFKAESLTADAMIVFLPKEKDAFNSTVAWIHSIWSAASAAFQVEDINGAHESTAVIYTGIAKCPRLIVVGTGESTTLTAERLRRAAAAAIKKATSLKCDKVAVVMRPSSLDDSVAAQSVVEGALLGSYSFDAYFTELKPEDRKKVTQVSLAVDGDDLAPTRRGAAMGEGVSNGVILARDLANTPSNDLHPESLAARCRELGRLGVKVTILRKTQIEKLRMGGLLAVNQGSARPPYFVIMEWNKGKSGEAPIVLVGKGITFDTGGISIKPGAGMSDMKMDMGGAAAVIGAMHAIAALKLNRRVIGLVPTTENMPSGSAYKPGDVITFMNGKTAEIDNTDAEGRLILADALSYASRYKPQAVIDLATLTGACVIALGSVATGLMGNNPTLTARLKESGDRTYDRVWELPLWEEYEELIKSDIADVKNSGGRSAGTITAGLFLKHFISDYPWAHLDIAGTGMTSKASGYINKGGTGAGVRLLVDMIQNWRPLDDKKI